MRKKNGIVLTHEGEKFYLVKARLKPGYEPRNLIKFYEDVRELAVQDAVQAYASCGALYGAYGKAGGDKESAVMSAVSLSLCAIFLLLAFKNLRIFCVVFVAIFGFACGLAASLLIYESLSVMVVVIGTSLVGLTPAQFSKAAKRSTLLPSGSSTVA